MWADLPFWTGKCHSVNETVEQLGSWHEMEQNFLSKLQEWEWNSIGFEKQQFLIGRRTYPKKYEINLVKQI